MRGESVNQYYEKIMALKEADEFKRVINRWQILSENIKKYPTDAPIILPDMLWIAKSGVGKTNLLRLMSEYIYSQKNLMEFYGDVKFFEFLLNYCSPGEPFTELQRLSDEVNNAAGFRNEFKGIVHININEWVEHFEEKHFISLMEYLSSNSDKWLIVLTAYSEDSKALHNLNAFLSMYLRIERIKLSLPKTEELFEYIESNLNEYGLKIEEDAKKLLYATIEKIRRNKYFDGYKSIKMLCQDIVYSIFSNGELKNYTLTADSLIEFAEDSDYVKRTVANIEKVNQIGLLPTRRKQNE